MLVSFWPHFHPKLPCFFASSAPPPRAPAPTSQMQLPARQEPKPWIYWCSLPSLKLTAKAPENRTLEKEIPIGKPPIFRGVLVSFREGSPNMSHIETHICLRLGSYDHQSVWIDFRWAASYWVVSSKFRYAQSKMWFKKSTGPKKYELGCPPLPVAVANEGL